MRLCKKQESQFCDQIIWILFRILYLTRRHREVLENIIGNLKIYSVLLDS